MATAEAEILIARNPATGREIARIAATPPEAVSGLVDEASGAASAWAERPIGERLDAARRIWSSLAKSAEPLADLIREEIGKPRPEAQMEMTATLDAIRWIVKNARRALAEERLSAGWQRFALMRPARLRWVPLGVVGIVGTWNYPLLLDAPAIVGALVAGNGVAWKPSEQSAAVARSLAELLADASLPPGLIAPLFGGPAVGRALAESGIDKGFFTGGVANGRRFSATLAGRGVPAVAELSGFDAAVVLPDAPHEATVKALTWAAFVGAGQTCVAVKRILVVGDETPWIESLTWEARGLRVGDPARDDIDVGPMISHAARTRFRDQVLEATARGAEHRTGEDPVEGDGPYQRPTVLLARDSSPVEALEGIFGPVVIVQGCRDEDAAVAAANAGPFGLAASVWSADRKRARVIAARLRAGMVTINDAVTPSGLASAPFGGVKGSGFGRVRGALGLREFAQPQVVHERGPGGFRPHLFPYSSRLGKVFAFYRRLFHPRG